MKKTEILLNLSKLFLIAILSFAFIQGCGKKDTTTTTDDKKSDNKTESKDITSLDKPMYVEFQLTGEINGTMKAYYKTKKLRSESTMKIAGNDATSTMYYDGTTIYTITEVAGMKTGMKMDASKYYDPKNKDNKAFDITSFKERMKDYTKVGEEDVAGKHCDIYQKNDDPNLKMSVYKDLIPLKIVREKMTMVATKLDMDINVSDDMFNPAVFGRHNQRHRRSGSPDRYAPGGQTSRGSGGRVARDAQGLVFIL